MINDTPPPDRRPHPLERRPEPAGNAAPRQRVTLHIPAVRPTATTVLILINVAIFLVRATTPEVDRQVFLWGANHPPDVLLNAEYYRLLSAMFLHAGLFDIVGRLALPNSLHLIFNMYILYAVGTSLERLFGHTRFLVVYLLGGLGGSVLSALLGSPNSYSVGASGAVFAILGAEFVYLYHHRRLLGASGRARRNSLLAFGIINLLFGLASTVAGSQMRIDNWAHLGGLAGGMALAWFISPRLTLRMHPDYPGEVLGEDTNPLSKSRNAWAISLYATTLIVLLFLGVLLARV